VHPVTPRGVRRYGRSSAVALAALGVLAGGVAVATPALALTATPTAVVSTAATTYTAPSSPTAATTPTAAAAAATRLAAATRVTHAYLWSNRSTSRPGQSVKLTGKVTYGASKARIRSQIVKLQVRTGPAWKTIWTKRPSANGYAVFWVKPGRSTTYRLAYVGATSLGRSASTREVITVKAAPVKAAPVKAAPARAAANAAPVRAVPVSSRGAQVVAAAAAQSGKWYRYGAAGPNYFDCSGFTQYVYKKFGVTLPHKANSQRSYGRAVSRASARPGDLIIFLSGGYGYHAAIYAGGGYMYDAPRAGQRVGKHRIWSSNVVFRRLV